MRNIPSFNLVKKITLIFLLLASMIANGQISEIMLYNICLQRHLHITFGT